MNDRDHLPHSGISRRQLFHFSQGGKKGSGNHLTGDSANLPCERPILPGDAHPVALPVNHGGIDLSELPPLVEAQLTREELGQLFDDIACEGTEIRLTVRLSEESRTASSVASGASMLKRAAGELLAGTVQRLQIRYCWQDALWIDTLERNESMFRLVRIRQPMPGSRC